MASNAYSAIRAYVSAFAFSVAALWVELAFARAGSAHSGFAAISAAIVLSSWMGGRGPGLFALLVSAAGSDYFLLNPGTFLRFSSLADGAAFLVFFTGWVGMVWLIGSLQRRTRAAGWGRIAAEAAADHAKRLAQVTAALGAARTSASAVETILQEPAHALHADAAMVLLLASDQHSATVARAIGYSEVSPAVLVSDHAVITDAVQRGVVIAVESRRAHRKDYPAAAADELLGAEGLAVVPLSLDHRIAAVLVLEFRRPRIFDAGDREFLEMVAARGAQALERTRQYESAERARLDAESLRARADQELAERQRTELALRASETQYRALAARTARLHELTAALSEAVTLEAVARAIVEHGKVVVGASAGDVLLLTSDGRHFQPLCSDSHQEDLIPSVPGLSLTEAIERRQPVFIRSFDEWQETSWCSVSLAADRGYASCAALPLLVDSKPIGVLAFQFSAPVNFEESYQTILTSVAQHCTQALDRARLYETAERARAEAETANRLKDEFLSMVSHELRTPLNAILGWASMLQEGTLEPAVTGRAVQSIYTNATRQARLIAELLDLSSIVSGRTKLECERIDFSGLLAGVVESVTPMAASSGVQLRFDPVPPVTLHGDVRRLEQVFLNVLSNALKFTPTGGSITLAVTQDDTFLEVRVTDTGIGIEPAFLPFVFDRFRQADSSTTRASGGLGLGLSIAKQLVEAHHGTIRVESAGPGHGATFTVRLPLLGRQPERADAAVVPARDDRTAPAPQILDGVRVLVVDDEADAREVIATALQARGARVTTAETASEGFSVLLHGGIDVLLADIAMPFEDGYSLMRRIRASADTRLASIPAIAVTACARTDEQRQALAAGYRLHLAKPIEAGALAQHVRAVVTG